MDLHIREEEAGRLAVQLAERTGESVDTAVTVALRERLERIAKRPIAERRASIAASSARMAALIEERAEPVPSQSELNDWMYDEHGLPR